MLIWSLSYILLILAMTMRSMLRLRLLVLASASVSLLFDFFWAADPVSLFWQLALFGVTALMLLLSNRTNARVSFNAEEQAMVDRCVPTLRPELARELLSAGIWANGTPGTELTTEGESVLFLTYLHEGEADIMMNGKKIGHCGVGNFIGELSVLSNAPATATAVLRTPARYWMIPLIRLRDYQRENPEIWAAFEAGISRDLGAKILEMNAQAAG